MWHRAGRPATAAIERLDPDRRLPCGEVDLDAEGPTLEQELAHDPTPDLDHRRTAPGAATPLTTPYDASYETGRSTIGGGACGRVRSSGNRSLPRVPILAHLDLDAFFAAVEELEDPRLRSLPLVVGGDPQGRGVVATANYVARRFGIQSAMSAAEALRRCPAAVFVRPRHAVYRQYSDAVWAAVGEVVPRVERTGLDEGYLDLGTVTAEFSGSRAVAEAVRTAVRASTSLSCSLGVSTSKVVCKVASDKRKPGGITVVPPGREQRFLAPLPVRRLPGVGPRAEARLAAVGISTVGGLATLGDVELRAVLPGAVGALLRDRACGVDPRDLELEAERTSISSEETFARDVTDRAVLHAELRRQAAGVAAYLLRSRDCRLAP